MQRLLSRLGYATGASDGQVTGRTAEAIRSFERDNGLPVTGEPGLNLLRQLRMAVAAAE
jgi:membrane-bound lytic murein transglycosylase B